jgi:hypothetical protein
MEGRGSKRPRKAVLAARYRVTGEEAKQKISILQNFTRPEKINTCPMPLENSAKKACNGRKALPKNDFSEKL